MKTALIAGGGIGGLAAGVALHRTGWDVSILERAPELREIGAGVQLSPNGTRLLRRWGIDLSEAFEPEAIEIRLPSGPLSGRPILRIPMAAAARARWGAPYLQMHRADLHAALLAALPEGTLRSGVAVTGYAGDRLTTDRGEMRADLIVGADGLRSALRAHMHGADAPRFTGNIAWRAVVQRADLATPPPPVGAIWAGHRRHAVTTWLRRGTLANFVGVVETAQAPPESWTAEGARDSALSDFADHPAPIRELIAAAPVLHRWPLYDRAPLPHWSDGPVTLLGDAAHPMLPSMAQGAVQAIEDAAALAARLSGATDIPKALRAHHAARSPRTSRVQRVSAANLRRFHRPGTLPYAHIAALGALRPALAMRQWDWLYGHDAEALDAA
ncbi:MAG: FAD-dependent monooxygenase [Paracoccaceae bacterium]